MEYLKNLWELFVDMSFYMIIGLVFTGILHAFVDKNLILKHVGDKSTASVVKASVVGVPLPLCSCGVVPTAIQLGKSGASKGAVVSFLTSTPQTGIDSIIATYGLMGPLFAVYRAIAAFLSGIFSGIMTNTLCKNEEAISEAPKSSCGCSHSSKAEPSKKSCGCSHSSKDGSSTKICGCSHGSKAEPSKKSCGCSHSSKDGSSTKSCGCSHNHTTKVDKISFIEKLKSVFSYGFGSFLDEIAGHFVVGLLVAALISTLIPEQLLSNFTNPILSMIIMLIIGTPMYICSTASIPIALTLMTKGISPGAAFVFLFAGPVTNIASLTVLYKSLGKKATAVYLGSVAICSIIFGLILDYIVNIFQYQGVSVVGHIHDHGTPTYMIAFAVFYGILLIRSFIKKYNNKSIDNTCCSH
ncbi:hypothetical protein AN396_02940 [Candidatus Epulonipiscium fishelsonii]|uniref:Uncharacterized protein n=1 Tax=Candidatus Epulonipiscium fishelsonii TaxID=77094 RepID=A0ACC8XF24_9FIRM|nr:hypothetical protein AN396_02940 [Epulopiscium sp. SCG-B11WGA-EpuloA1]